MQEAYITLKSCLSLIALIRNAAAVHSSAGNLFRFLLPVGDRLPLRTAADELSPPSVSSIRPCPGDGDLRCSKLVLSKRCCNACSSWVGVRGKLSDDGLGNAIQLSRANKRTQAMTLTKGTAAAFGK
eukprot:3559497-Rhodomonas_salina.1